MGHDRLLTTKEAAEFLGLHPVTLAAWRVARRGPRYVKLSARAVRYRLRDLELYLDRQAVGATHEMEGAAVA